ncbi:MAG: bifunctional UDP-3-O-[Bacteroidales bacterium]|nr:bifunctional UDP-3-O-[3-hydroxymyristoyl] N-acetylglucosamine deacetylase/3-hydroxyacyl-ACP dehydratase [Bacteroidales bacterium]
MRRQKTIKNEVNIEGKGLHSGKLSHVTLKPASENKGILFRRVDLESKTEIPAKAEFIGKTARNTTIEKDGVSVSTIEHLMATLSAFGIDNLEVEVDCEELPILDGSAYYWTELLKKAQLQEQDAEKKVFKITQPVHFLSDDNKTEYWALPADGFSVDCTIDFNSSLIGTQIAELKDLSSFESDFAKCRTFVFLNEIIPLIENNLIKGGDLSNAIIFVDKVLEEDLQKKIADFFSKNISDIKVERGVLNNLQLSFDNEPARHKVLDFIGDVSLASMNIEGHFIIKRPGHTNNKLFAQKLLQIMENKDSIPVYDPNKEPVFDIMDIRKRLPHRFPMLLVDKIIEKGEDYVVGLKNVTGNEDFFNGHFPEEPVMPGVLIVEALGQTGGLFVLKDAKEDEKFNTYFMKFEEVKFRNKVVPGDTLLMKISLMEPIRRGIVKMKGIAYVGNKICVEAILMALVTKA